MNPPALPCDPEIPCMVTIFGLSCCYRGCNLPCKCCEKVSEIEAATGGNKK